MCRWVVVLALGAVACEGDPITLPDDSGDDNCPAGMQASSTSFFRLLNFQVNGLSLQYVYEPDETVNDRPASCISADGQTADWLFSVIDTPFGQITATSAAAGGQDLNGTAASLTIDLFGAEPPATYTNGEWQTGTWIVDQVGATFEMEVIGSAVDTGSTVTVNLEAEATR